MSEHNYLIGREVTSKNPYDDTESVVRVAGCHRELGITLKDVNDSDNEFCLNKERYEDTSGISYEEYYDFVVGQLTTGYLDVTNHLKLKERYKDGHGTQAVCAFQ